jgi:hypothetical protein|tara:strand:- start:4778 stop:5014 length:237 start_codon:yes stop_codon:yes gene_type:complete
MEFRGQIYNTLNDWIEAEVLAHSTCKDLGGYTSDAYQAHPIETTDNKFILVELEGFEDVLSDFNFKSLDKSIIKVEDI